MKGTYVLLVKMEKPKKVPVGRLGVIGFRGGFYAYVGSALNGLEKRIERHLRDEKKLHWHIDYLLKESGVLEVFRLKSNRRLECVIAGKLSEEFAVVPLFGCSDCSCKSHLFYSPEKKRLKDSIEPVIDALEKDN